MGASDEPTEQNRAAAAAKARLWTVPPSVPFLERLADALIAGTLVPASPDGGPFSLSDHLVLLPTRRACRALGEILAARAGDEALLLPRIRPIGDVDEVELALSGRGVLGDAALALQQRPAISSLRRHVLLTELILGWGRTIAQSLMVPGRDEPVAIPVVPGDAAYLARDLAKLIDDFETEGQAFSGLSGLVPDDHAAYWRLTVEFLRIATVQWPAILEAERAVDPATRRDALLRAEAARLRSCPPPGPVVAAGSTGTIPATADLLAAVARLPIGAVVLPGLDLDLDDDSWAAIDETLAPQPGHPQYGLKRLLGRLGARRGDVEMLTAPERPARERIVSEAFRPVATTDRWAEVAGAIAPAAFAEALDGLVVLEASGEQEEALAIALGLREAIATPGRTAALVTPDRALARRVAVELRRWDIVIEDSAGLPLADTAAGTLFRLISDAAAMRLTPVRLVALLQHPLAAFGLEPAAARRAARFLELIALRGPRPSAGGAGLVRTLRHAFERRATARLHPAARRLAEADWRAAIELGDRITAALKPLETLDGHGALALADLVSAHAGALAAVAATPQGSTLDGDDAVALERFVDDLSDAARGGLSLELPEYPALLRAMMAGIPVRPRAAGHPRLSILGPLEARLLSADVIVLGGLVEGVWPADTRTDPFLNRPMRRDVGLEAPERFIGLAAHDVAQALCAGTVIISHATKIGGAPAVASRWLQRMKAVVGKPRWTGLVEKGRRYRYLACTIDYHSGPPEPLGEPTPRPPVARRPDRLSVTEIETLIRDPYAIYARRILRLEPLAKLDELPDAAERGNIIHDALADYVRAVDAGEQADLIAIGERLFESLDDFPEIRAFWWPRFLRVAKWFVVLDVVERADLKMRVVERAGDLRFPVAGLPFRLTGRGDRFDISRSGSLRVVDYKTGAAPSDKQVRIGLAPQLPLEAAMAMDGGFGPDIAGLTPDRLVYVELRGGRSPGEVRDVAPEDGSVAEFARATLSSLTRLLERFADPDQPYYVKPRSQFARRITDYDHLSRWPEWGANGGGD